LKKNERLFSDSKLNLNLKPDSAQFTARTREKEGQSEKALTIPSPDC
jgi:hypothetical protein